MNLRIKTRGILSLLAIPIISVACMDINPVTGVEGLQQESLISQIRLPYQRAFLGPGDTVPIRPLGLLINADTIDLDPDKISYTMNPLSGLVTLDSILGRATLNGYDGTERYTIIASYQVDGITRGDTLIIYAHDQSLDISHIKMTPLDSSRSGPTHYVSGLGSYYGITVHLTNGDTLDNIHSYNRPFTYHGVHAVTGHRIGIGSTLVATDVQGVFKANNTGMVDSIWLVSTSYMFGMPVRDSAIYKGLYPVEAPIFITHLDEQTMEIIYEGDAFHAECGYITFATLFPILMEIELEGVTQSVPCNGAVPPDPSPIHISNETGYKTIQIGMPPGSVYGFKAKVLEDPFGIITGVSIRSRVIVTSKAN